MAEVHFHIWLYIRDPHGVIRSMVRDENRFDKRRKDNYTLEMFRREQSLASQVIQCVDGAFCQPPPDWVVRGCSLAGPREVPSEQFIDRTSSIRPSRKILQGMEQLQRYVEDHLDRVVRRPSP